MGDFLTKISGQITGSIILGSFFPTVLFVTAVALIILPVTPYSEQLTTAVALLKIWDDKASTAIFLTAVVLVLAVLLYMLNIPIIRLYEGYPWEGSWIGGKLRDQERKRFDDATSLRANIRDLRREIRLGKLSVDNNDLARSQRSLARILNDEFPSSGGLVLPTRLGNVVRSFETYPLLQYGMPAIAVWPRLQGVIPAPYAQGLDGAQTSFNFMLNCSFLSAISAVLLAVCGLRWENPFQPGSSLIWMAWVLVFLGLWRVFYIAAIDRAAEWGTQVKAAFDLYRGLLLTQLGYDLKPETPAEERRIWDAINYKLSFPDDRSYPELPYKKQSTSLLVDPASVVATFTRSVQIIDADILRVKIVVANTDPGEFDASDVVLRDEISPGQSYVADSSVIEGIPKPPIELNPIRIRVGKLEAGKSLVVTYKLKVAAKS